MFRIFSKQHSKLILPCIAKRKFSDCPRLKVFNNSYNTLPEADKRIVKKECLVNYFNSLPESSKVSFLESTKNLQVVETPGEFAMSMIHIIGFSVLLGSGTMIILILTGKV